MEAFDDFLAAPGFVELKIAEQRLGDAEMFEQLSRVARVLGGDHVAFLQYAQRVQGDVLEVADGRGDQIKRARHERWQLHAPD